MEKPTRIITGVLSGMVGILPAAFVVDRHQKRHERSNEVV